MRYVPERRPGVAFVAGEPGRRGTADQTLDAVRRGEGDHVDVAGQPRFSHGHDRQAADNEVADPAGGEKIERPAAKRVELARRQGRALLRQPDPRPDSEGDREAHQGWAIAKGGERDDLRGEQGLAQTS